MTIQEADAIIGAADDWEIEMIFTEFDMLAASVEANDREVNELSR